MTFLGTSHRPFLAAVPPACHLERAPAVAGGQPVNKLRALNWVSSSCSGTPQRTRGGPGEKALERLRAQCPNRAWGSLLAALLRHMTTNRPDEQAWISLAVPGRLMGSLQVFRKWSANLSYCHYMR